MEEYEQQKTEVGEFKIFAEKKKQKKKTYLKLFFLTLPLVVVFLIYSWFLTTAPNKSFPSQLEISEGMTAQSIASKAAEENLVRSEFILYTALSLFHDPTNIHAGRYVFTEPMSVFAIANQIASNKAELDLISVTFPEGITVREMASIAADSSDAILYEDFLKAAKGQEGYLFPETYFIPTSMTADELVDLQKRTFINSTALLKGETDMSFDDVVTLASIVEREANSEESMRTVAGIFLNRLEIGMALQADASIEYVMDTPLNELPAGQLASELRELDSPYNTYLYPGLPPTPIGNPGYTAIASVVNPIISDYFYYLTAPDGTFYYAKTLEEHNANIANYLLE